MVETISLSVMMLLGTTQAAPYYLVKPNSAFYLPSTSAPTAIPPSCVVWDRADPGCRCDLWNNSASTMMIDPSSILPSYYLKTWFGWFNTNSG